MTDFTERVYALSRRAGFGSGPARFVALAAAAIGAFVAVAEVTDPMFAVQCLGLLAVGVAGIAVCAVYPQLIWHTFAIVLGALPFMPLRGSGFPLIFLLAVGLYGCMLLNRPGTTSIHPIEVVFAVFMVLSLVSVLMTMRTGTDVNTFVKWAISAGVLFPLARLGHDRLMVIGRSFVLGVIGGSLIAWASLLGAGGDQVLRLLGYAVTDGNLRYYVENGVATTVRLAGPYVDPNLAGLFLSVGFFVAVYVTRGPLRIIAILVIGSAIAMTLSRAAMFSIVVAALLVIVLQPMPQRRRLGLIVGSISALLVAVALSPTLYRRLFSTGSAGDTGMTERADALNRFPRLMEGHWWFGLGWGRTEFFDTQWGYVVNYVANTPLLTMYRGGALASLALVAVLLVGIGLGIRSLQTGTYESGWIGAGFCGFALVAVQVDFPIVTMPMATILFSFFLAIVADSTRQRARPDGPGAHSADRTVATTADSEGESV